MLLSGGVQFKTSVVLELDMLRKAPDMSLQGPGCSNTPTPQLNQSNPFALISRPTVLNTDVDLYLPYVLGPVFEYGLRLTALSAFILANAVGRTYTKSCHCRRHVALCNSQSDSRLHHIPIFQHRFVSGILQLPPVISSPSNMCLCDFLDVSCSCEVLIYS
jgi:hypothetical protein